nr:glycosyltransferase [Streptomyces boncukensis]
MPDGYGDRLFAACAEVAKRLLAAGHDARLVFVTGPYYAGRPLSQTPNVTVRRYEPRLAALLAAAHVAVIKPGNNALSEALNGNAHLVLVPDVSFLEGLDEHAGRVVDEYGGAISTADPDTLEELIRDALAQPPRMERPAENPEGLLQTLDVIDSLAEPVKPRVPMRQLMLALNLGEGRSGTDLCSVLPPLLESALLLDGTPMPHADDGVHSGIALPSGEGTGVVALSGGGPSVPPQELVDRGVRLAITPGPIPREIARWAQLAPAVPSLGILAAEHVTAREGCLDESLARIARATTRHEPACVIVDLSRLTDDGSLKQYLHGLAEWLGTQPVRLLGSEETIALVSQRLLEHS